MVCTGVAPPPLYMHSSCLVGTSLVVFGGCHKAGYRAATADLYILDTGMVTSLLSFVFLSPTSMPMLTQRN
jgi:hypothetical protein